MPQKLFVIAAPSGAGKTSVIEGLLKKNPHVVQRVVTSTTRRPREGEVDEVHYRFRTIEQFEGMIAREELVEHARFPAQVGNFYGTEKAALEGIWKRGKYPLLNIECIGVANVRQIYGSRMVAIWMDGESPDVVEQRLRARGDHMSEDEIKRRLKQAEFERSQGHLFDHCVVNRTGELDSTIVEITHIILTSLDPAFSCSKK